MADQDELDVDCIVTSPGIGYHDSGQGGSQISHPQPLTIHSPLVQNGLDGENRLQSSIVRDGRLQSGDYRRKLDRCSQAKQRAMEEVDTIYQICEDLCAENERLKGENMLLQAEDGLCRNCRLSLSIPVTESERTIREKDLEKQLEEAHTKTAQLQHRCKELLDEVTRLKGGSYDGARGDLQYPTLPSNVEDKVKSLTHPKQTVSIGNDIQNVDPLILAVNEGRQDQGGAIEQAARPAVVERAKTPSPDDCAIFLADQIKSGGEINTLLRNMNLNSVEIADLEERHPKNPKEFRIDGIKTGMVSAKASDRVTFLLDALEKSKLNHQVDLFCDEFNIQRRRSKVGPIQAKGPLTAQKPLQASSPDDFADSPCLEPQSDFETVLQPFLLDPASIHTIAVELGKEKDFTVAQLKQFKASFPRWKQQHRQYLKKEGVSRCTMDILNVWASVEVERTKGGSGLVQGIEFLAQALRTTGRMDILEKLKSFLRKGVVGPSLKRDQYLRDIDSYALKVEIIQYLGLNKEAGHDDWRALTRHIGHARHIVIWEQEHHPAEVLWNVWLTSNDATIGKLYDWAVGKNRLDIAGVLESEF